MLGNRQGCHDSYRENKSGNSNNRVAKRNGYKHTTRWGGEKYHQLNSNVIERRHGSPEDMDHRRKPVG